MDAERLAAGAAALSRAPSVITVSFNSYFGGGDDHSKYSQDSYGEWDLWYREKNVETQPAVGVYDLKADLPINGYPAYVQRPSVSSKGMAVVMYRSRTHKCYVVSVVFEDQLTSDLDYDETKHEDPPIFTQRSGNFTLKLRCLSEIVS